MTRPILILSAAALGLSACTLPDVLPRPDTTADPAVGAQAGQEMEGQAAALRAGMSSKGISVVNTGAELVVTLPNDMTFPSGTSALTPAVRSDLAALARNLNAFPGTAADIISHTDSTGDAGANQLLTTERAAAIMAALVSNGVDVNRLRAIGRGESDPKASNLSEGGRAENRRVEIIIRPAT